MRSPSRVLPLRVWLAAATYALVMTLLGIVRYAGFASGADLGLFVQSTSQPSLAMPNVYEGGSHYLHHFSPVLYLAMPFVQASRSPVALIALQAIAGALVAPPLYLLARRRLDAGPAALLASGALLYPPLVGVTFSDFHENGFAPAAIAWLIWAVDARRWAAAALFCALTLAIKEDEAYVLATIGIGYVLWRRRDPLSRRFAAGTAFAAVIVLALYFLAIRPAAGGTGAWFALRYLDSENAQAAHGFAALSGRLTYVLEALAPLLFVPLRTPAFALVLPGLFETLVSRWPITYTNGQHYAGVWIGEMLVAYLFAVAAIARERPVAAQRLVRATCVVCALWLIVASPTHWAHYLRVPGPHEAALQRAIAMLPPGAGVGAYDEVYAHLGFDPRARNGYDGDRDYLIVDRAYRSQAMRTLYAGQLRAQLAHHAWDVVCVGSGVAVYRKLNAGSAGPPRKNADCS